MKTARKLKTLEFIQADEEDSSRHYCMAGTSRSTMARNWLVSSTSLTWGYGCLGFKKLKPFSYEAACVIWPNRGRTRILDRATGERKELAIRNIRAKCSGRLTTRIDFVSERDFNWFCSC